MIEIIILYFLARKNGQLAEQKGESKLRWRLFTVLAWFGVEIVAIALGIMLLGEQNLLLAGLLGLVAGFGGYLMVRYTLEQKPDVGGRQNDLIDRIGKDQESD